MVVPGLAIVIAVLIVVIISMKMYYAGKPKVIPSPDKREKVVPSN